MPEDSLTPEAAQAKLDTIMADPTHGYHKGDDNAVQHVYELTKQSLGERGRAVLFEMGMPSPPSSYTPPPVGTEATPTTPAKEPITTPQTALDVADEMGFDTAEMSKLITLEAQQPAGQYSKGQALHNYGPTERAELERLHAKGFARFPLSLQLHLERRGTQFAPGIFGKIVELGGRRLTKRLPWRQRATQPRRGCGRW